MSSQKDPIFSSHNGPHVLEVLIDLQEPTYYTVHLSFICFHDNHMDIMIRAVIKVGNVIGKQIMGHFNFARRSFRLTGNCLCIRGTVVEDDVTDMEKPVPAACELRVQLMPEYLVVCAWHTIKEVSLLLGQLTSTAPVIDPSRVSDLTNEVDDTYLKVTDFGCNPSETTHDGLLTVELVSEHRTV